MSQENVELVRRGFAALNRGDVDEALEMAADDVVMDWSNAIGPDQGVYRGVEEVRALWTSLHEGLEAIQWEPEEFIEVDENRLIAVAHARMRGRSSGIDVAMDAAGFCGRSPTARPRA
jgi:ketosteroid isomerase-like protein